MKTYNISLYSLILAVISVAAVSCQDEGLSLKSYSEDTITFNYLAAFPSKETNELKKSFNASITDLINSLITKLLDTKIGSIISEAIFDTPNFVAKVNLLLEKDVLILNGNGLRISFKNLTEVVKLQALNFLENHLRLNGLLLRLTGGYTNKIIDDFSQEIEPEVSKVEFTVLNDDELKEVSDTSVQSYIRKIILEFVIILIKPFQSSVNETLLNITNQLLSLYRPVLPNDYFQSILTCGINQSILKAIDVVEAVRDVINGLFKSHGGIAKRSVDVAEGSGIKSRSLIGLIIAPIRFLLTLILTPVHKILKRLMNYTFVTLRPIVGQFIMSPLESIIMNIINLIPCSNC